MRQLHPGTGWRRLVAPAAPLLAVAALQGCAYLSQPRLTAPPPESAHVAVDVAPFRGPPERLLRHYGARQISESLTFRGEGARLELIYHVLTDQVHSPSARAQALAFPRWRMRERLRGWNFHRDGSLEWRGQGEVHAAGWPHGPEALRYLRYRLVPAGRECAGFEAEWDAPGYDPDFSPRKLLFGYYCRLPGQPLSEERIREVLGALQIRARPTALESAPAVRWPAAGEGEGPVAKPAGAATGHAGFPFRFRTVQGQINGDDDGRD